MHSERAAVGGKREAKTVTYLDKERQLAGRWQALLELFACNHVDAAAGNGGASYDKHAKNAGRERVAVARNPSLPLHAPYM